MAVYKCVKGSDSTFVSIGAPPNVIQNHIADSLNSYANHGYVCTFDDSSTYYECQKGAQGKKDAEATGENCGLAPGQCSGYYCGPYVF